MDGWLWASNSEINLYMYYQVHSDVTCILCQQCACATWPKISFPPLFDKFLPDKETVARLVLICCQNTVENHKTPINIPFLVKWKGKLTYRGRGCAGTSHGGKNVRHVLRFVAIVVVLPTIHRFKKYFCNFDDLSGTDIR